MAPLGNKDVVLGLNGKIMALAAAAILVLTLGRKLWSEALTLVTSYPVPSGIYNQIVTTGNSGAGPADTILNRNAGNTILAPSTNAAGKVGIGTDSPAGKLDVAGDVKATSGRFEAGVQVGDDPSACGAGKAGALRWHGGKFEGCDGAQWISLQADPNSPKCYEAGGSWSSAQNLCYFPGGTCPAGWTTTTYTSTARNTCIGDNRCCPAGTIIPSNCSTGNHFRNTTATELCSYAIASRTPPGCFGSICRTYDCFATVTERGCIAPP